MKKVLIDKTKGTLATSDIYTVGQFKDDCIQKITASWDGTIGNTHEHAPTGAVTKHVTGSDGQAEGYFFSQFEYTFNSGLVTRSGNITRGKRKGVKFIIKVL